MGLKSPTSLQSDGGTEDNGYEGAQGTGTENTVFVEITGYLPSRSQVDSIERNVNIEHGAP